VSAFFSVVYQAIEEFLAHPAHEQLQELIVIALTSIGMLLVIEPILERIGPVRMREATGRKDSILIRAGAFLTIVATSLLHGLLHSHISESIGLHGLMVLEQLLTALVAPTLITLAWLYGVKREGPQAKWYGLIVGLLTGVGLVGLAMVQLYFLETPAELREVSAGNNPMALLAVARSLLRFVVPSCALNGFLGGLAIDRQWSPKAWHAVALGLSIAVVAEAALFLAASHFEANAIGPAALVPPEMFASMIGEVVIANLGWVMGLLVRQDADALLRTGRSSPMSSPATQA
jgi:hypothetical protein